MLKVSATTNLAGVTVQQSAPGSLLGTPAGDSPVFNLFKKAIEDCVLCLFL